MNFDLNVLWKLAAASTAAAVMYLTDRDVPVSKAYSIVSGLQFYIFAGEVYK